MRKSSNTAMWGESSPQCPAPPPGALRTWGKVRNSLPELSHAELFTDACGELLGALLALG